MITIRDVAQEAGVSIATVSRVLNNTAKVAPETRKRVLKVVKRMGFKLSPSPRNHSAFKTIGLIVPNLMGNHYGEIAMGIESYTYGQGYDLLVAATQNTEQKEIEILEDYFKRRVDGVLICTMQSDEQLLERLIESGIPIVAVDHRVGEIKADSVNIDNISASHAIAKYLFDHGHREILCVAGPQEVYSSQDREKGLLYFSHTHPDFNLKFAEIRGFEPEHGYKAVKHYLSIHGKDFTAVFSFNDHVCMGSMKALTDHGLKIPDDVSVMGFDDSIFAPYTIPALTTVSQPRLEMGRLSAQLLIERLTSERSRLFKNIILPTKIIERESVKALSKETIS